MTLESDERRVLDVLVADQPESATIFLKLVSPFPNYKTILEHINEKALDFYDETVINTDEILPFVEEDYLEEIKEQHDDYYDKNKADLIIEEQRRLAEEKSARLEEKLKKSEIERQRLEEEYCAAEARRVAEEEERAKIAETQRRAEEEKIESMRVQAEEQRVRLEDELRKAEAARQQLESERKQEEELRKAEENRKAKAMQEAEQQKIHYRQMKVCQYCGGTFNGLINKKCKVCGKPKDYA